jgi:hypothetical protein
MNVTVRLSAPSDPQLPSGRSLLSQIWLVSVSLLALFWIDCSSASLCPMGSGVWQTQSAGPDAIPSLGHQCRNSRNLSWQWRFCCRRGPAHRQRKSRRRANRTPGCDHRHWLRRLFTVRFLELVVDPGEAVAGNYTQLIRCSEAVYSLPKACSLEENSGRAVVSAPAKSQCVPLCRGLASPNMGASALRAFR